MGGVLVTPPWTDAKERWLRRRKIHLPRGVPLADMLGEAPFIIMAEKESKTKSFVLRVDAETMAAIEKWAADEFRSTNGQLQWIIAEALKKSGRMKKRKGEAL